MSEAWGALSYSGQVSSFQSNILVTASYNSLATQLYKMSPEQFFI